MAKGKGKQKKAVAPNSPEASQKPESEEANMNMEDAKKPFKFVDEQGREYRKEFDIEKKKNVWYNADNEKVPWKIVRQCVTRNFTELAKAQRDKIAALPEEERAAYYKLRAAKGVKSRKLNKKRLQGDLIFPVKTIQEKMIKDSSRKVTTEAAVFTAAVLEYMQAEVLELSGEAAQDFGKSRIVPRYIMLAIRNDPEIDTVFDKTTTFREAGTTMKPVPKMLAVNKASRKNADWDETKWFNDLDNAKTMGNKSKKNIPKHAMSQGSVQ